MNITVKDVFTLNITPRYRRLHKINNYLFVLMMKNRNNIFTCVCVGVCVCVCPSVCVCGTTATVAMQIDIKWRNHSRSRRVQLSPEVGRTWGSVGAWVRRITGRESPDMGGIRRQGALLLWYLPTFGENIFCRLHNVFCDSSHLVKIKRTTLFYSWVACIESLGVAPVYKTSTLRLI